MGAVDAALRSEAFFLWVTVPVLVAALLGALVYVALVIGRLPTGEPAAARTPDTRCAVCRGAAASIWSRSDSSGPRSAPARIATLFGMGPEDRLPPTNWRTLPVTRAFFKAWKALAGARV